MKTKRKKAFGVTIMVAVIICFGINTYSHCQYPTNSVAYSSISKTSMNFASPDLDSFEDDQISQPFYYYPIVETVNLFILPVSNRLVIKHLLSIWQPPQLF